MSDIYRDPIPDTSHDAVKLVLLGWLCIIVGVVVMLTLSKWGAIGLVTGLVFILAAASLA